MMRSQLHASRTVATAALATVLLLAAGCGGEDAAPLAKAGGSPHAAALSSGANCSGTTVHQKHKNMFQCVTCHPCSTDYGFDTPYTFDGGTTTAGGTLTRGDGTTPPSCTVACHFPKGAPAKAVEWTAPGPLACTECHALSVLPPTHPPVSASATREDCQACHDIGAHMEGDVVLVGHDEGWISPATPENLQFHAYAANAGIAGCQGCHGQDLAGGAARVSCGSCHDQDLPQGVTSWKAHCTMCHGGADTPTGAPPVATWGNGGDPIRIGAHTAHTLGSAIAPAFDCAVCHTKPSDALSTGHMDGGTAEVIFGGIAAGGPTWSRTLGTCAVYCHGSTLDAGGTDTSPSWTGGPVACGSCHGAPPPAPHPVAVDLTTCTFCHPETMDAAGAIIAPGAGGKHLDGIVEKQGHVEGWMDTAGPDFHAYSANHGLAACQECHGEALDGVGGVPIGCDDCHGATWKTSCTMCHGGTDNATGAPPQAIWGSTSAVAVGAHSSHVGPNPISGAIGCVECHAVPTDALSPGHIGGSAVVSFAGPVSGLKGGTWDFPSTGTATCSSTYCHGNFKRGIATNAPDWNGTDEAACGTCHPARPLAYLHYRHQRRYGIILDASGAQWWPLPGTSDTTAWVTCDQCHHEIARSVSSSGTPTLEVVNGSGPALHVNGRPDVVFKAGGTYTNGSTQGTCSSMACHPGEVKNWPK